MKTKQHARGRGLSLFKRTRHVPLDNKGRIRGNPSQSVVELAVRGAIFFGEISSVLKGRIVRILVAGKFYFRRWKIRETV